MKIHSNATRRSKSQSYGLVKKLFHGEQLSHKETCELLLFYAPALPKKPTTAFQWVAMACADRYDGRNYLQGVHVKDGVMTATNGHRLHQTATDLEDGMYCPRTGYPMDDDGSFGRYPDTARVKPAINIIDDYIDHTPVRHMPESTKGVPTVQLGDSYYVSKYYDQAMSFGDDHEMFIKNGTLVIKTQDTYSIVTSYRI
jgi:hypothetical protein